MNVLRIGLHLNCLLQKSPLHVFLFHLILKKMTTEDEGLMFLSLFIKVNGNVN